MHIQKQICPHSQEYILSFLKEFINIQTKRYDRTSILLGEDKEPGQVLQENIMAFRINVSRNKKKIANPSNEANHNVQKSVKSHNSTQDNFELDTKVYHYSTH